MPGPVSHVPFIPDNAPFTAEQRAWLNGFLAGIYSSAEPAAEPPPALKIAVLYASQSGTAEGLARKVTKELTAKGHVVTLSVPGGLYARIAGCGAICGADRQHLRRR